MPEDFYVRLDYMSPEPARRLASVTQPERWVDAGDSLPALWQWAYFSGHESNEQLGTDGHLRRDDHWVTDFPRRVAGGGRVRRIAPLVVGVETERRSNLVRAEEKSGTRGPFVICDWHHAFFQTGTLVLEEVQTVIYRPADPHNQSAQTDRRPASPGPPVASPVQPAPVAPVRQFHFDPVLLFRFSAVTWNSHRIHYDRDYAWSEGYPGLLVQGPLLALLLEQEAERTIGEPRLIEFRAQSPVFDTETITLYLDAADKSCHVEVRKQDGTVAMALEASVDDD